VDLGRNFDHELEVTRVELTTLYDLLRTSDLNTRYFGRKAAALSKRYRALQIITALSSAATVAGFLQQVPLWGKSIWLLFGGSAAIASAIASVYNFPTRIARLEHLHESYNELFHQLEFLLHDIRRSGSVGPEHLGASRVLQQIYSRMGPKDEPSPSRRLIERLQAEVNEALPPDRMWMPKRQLQN
jgi:hypothetical protein